MALKKHNFLPLYSKDKNDLYKDFYKPCMENSISYDRMTGYFGSSIFVIIIDALKTFVKNNGKIRLITSPVISESDYAAIMKGYSERTNEIITDSVIREIIKIEDENVKSLELLSTLISHNILEIKLALFLGKDGSSYSQLFHDKIGIFSDEFDNRIVFGGSMNETFNGISEQGNLESFSVYTNWEDNKDSKRVKIYKERFDEIWDNKSDSVLTIDIPNAALEVIQKYNKDANVEELITSLTTKKEVEIPEKWYAETGVNRRKARKHQISVLNNWEQKGRRGIFEMATGSGKTFTALCAVRDSLNRNEIPIIIVPSNILLNQWREEIDHVFRKDNVSVLLCGGNNRNWKKNNMLGKFSNPKSKVKRIIISTIQTASSSDFLKQINMSDKLFLIIDEVHRSGANKFSQIFNIKSGPRIGLSATPERFRDPVGTKKIYDYFEGVIEPKYTIYDAIRDGNLTPYNYNFFTVKLTEKEQEEWNELTKEINKKIAILNSGNYSSDLEIDSSIEMLLINRARIVKKAENKIDAAIDLIEKEYRDDQSWLIYCEDQEQLNKILTKLRNKNFRTYYYIADMQSDKRETLKVFENLGGVLVAIKCLDEGVDIPSVTHALILASSTNPREYIQRRGRVLRKYPGKDYSYIIDALALPEKESSAEEQTGLSIIKSEIARALQFSENAVNKVYSYYSLNKLAIEYKIDLDIDTKGGFEYD